MFTFTTHSEWRLQIGVERKMACVEQSKWICEEVGSSFNGYVAAESGKYFRDDSFLPKA
jgi:hypothetical protein